MQRTLASRSMLDAKGGVVFTAYLKYLPLWIMVFPGMVARILYPDRVGCASPEQCLAVCGSERGCTNSAYVELVLNLLPAGNYYSKIHMHTPDVDVLSTGNR